MATAKIVFALSVLCLFTPAQTSPQDYKRMMTYLDYITGPEVSPQTSTDVPVQLNIKLNLMNIMEANRVLNQVKIDTLLSLSWNSGVTFDPEEYNNISSFSVPVSKMWIPDLAVYDGDLEMRDENPIRQNVILASNGQVNWIHPVKISLSCNLIGMRRAATTTCSVQMGCWTFSGSQVTLNVQKPAMVNKNTKFQLLSVAAKRQVQKYDCCPDDYENMMYTFSFKRKS